LCADLSGDYDAGRLVRVLKELGGVFKEGISGWAVRFPLERARCASDTETRLLNWNVVAKHARSTECRCGAFYRFLREHGIDPNVEAGYIAWKFGVDDSACAISRHDHRRFLVTLFPRERYRGRGNGINFQLAM